MGTNDNRDRKLLHHEKAIWQHAFKESMKHTSVEGAERNGWKAVDACYRARLFHEEPTPNQNENDCRLAITHIRQWTETRKKTLSENQFTDFWKVMRDFDEARITLEEFRYLIDQIGVID